MTFLGNLKIGQRLALAFGVLILMLAAICAFAALTAKRLAGELERTAQVDMAQTRAAGGIAAQVATLARASRELLIVDSAGQMKKQREAINGALTQLDADFAALAADNTLDAAKLDAVRSGQAAFKDAVAKFMTAEVAGNPDATKAALLIDLKPVQSAFEKSLGELRAAIDERAATRAAQGQATARTALVSMLAVGLAGTLLAVGAAIAIARSVVRPLAEATAAAERIRAGDLTLRIHSGARDEIGALLRAMGAMQQHLLDTIQNVLTSARDVAVSSDELAHGNAELSTRTERAAGNLQQTASAMEQISVTVAGSSAKSREASGVAGKARDAVVEGGAAVDKLVETMTRISTSSARIKDIIAVIDGIAFQTNILALNAAVEAARAGEQGRGFAVVAAEVRSLAARASGAAKEIKTLIDDSAERVADGTETVADVGQRIKAIVAEVMSVRQLIEEVSVAGHEQASGMVSVNRSVTELDQSTQQNAALVEEIAATAESLKSNAKRLVSAVEFFRLPGAPVAA